LLPDVEKVTLMERVLKNQHRRRTSEHLAQVVLRCVPSTSQSSDLHWKLQNELIFTEASTNAAPKISASGQLVILTQRIGRDLPASFFDDEGVSPGYIPAG
jgi:hypothetical protein